MQLKSRIAQILRGAHSSAQRERELHEEIRGHIELEAQDNIECGMTPAEARRAAYLKFGNTQLAHDEAASAWRLPRLESLLADLKFGSRVLWKSAVFACVSVLTIALGIGCAAGIFTVAHAVRLKPQPYPEGQQIVLLWGSDGRAANRGQVSFTSSLPARTAARVDPAETLRSE